MGLLDGILRDDALYSAANADEFGEEATYTPVGGSARTVIVAVDRYPPERLDSATGDVIANHLEVYVLDNSSVGLDSPPEPGRDTISVPRREGESARTLTVHEIIRQDPAGWLVMVR